MFVCEIVTSEGQPMGIKNKCGCYGICNEWIVLYPACIIIIYPACNIFSNFWISLTMKQNELVHPLSVVSRRGNQKECMFWRLDKSYSTNPGDNV
jgi:hypothetical protein